jgi:hypothetical protein
MVDICVGMHLGSIMVDTPFETPLTLVMVLSNPIETHLSHDVLIKTVAIW